MIIAGLGALAAPAALAALPAAEGLQRLLLSGRVLRSDGKPISGATVAVGRARTLTDADGRFMLDATTARYRVSYRGRSTEGWVSDCRPDGEGSWRASIGITLA